MSLAVALDSLYAGDQSLGGASERGAETSQCLHEEGQSCDRSLQRGVLLPAIGSGDRARTAVSVKTWDPGRERIRAFREGRVEFKPHHTMFYAWLDKETSAHYQLQPDHALTEHLHSPYDAYRKWAWHSMDAAVKYLELIRAVDRPERLGPEPVLYDPVRDAARQASRMRPVVRRLNSVEEWRRLRLEHQEWLWRHRRSLQVFEQHLTAEQLAEWRSQRCVTIASRTGWRYCITPYPSYNVFLFSGEPAQYCVTPEGRHEWPLGDVMLAQLLLLRHDPGRFFAIANKRFIGPIERQMASPKWLQSRRQLVTGIP